MFQLFVKFELRILGVKPHTWVEGLQDGASSSNCTPRMSEMG